MASILTNASAMTALQTLQNINKNMATTQNRIATGERVSQASDNAAYWSISTGMRAQNSALGAVKDSLGFGAAVVDTAYTALSEAITKMEDIFEKYTAIEQGGVDEDALNAEITQLKSQITGISQNADFEGQNLLRTGGQDLTIVTGYIKNAAATVTQGTPGTPAVVDGDGNETTPAVPGTAPVIDIPTAATGSPDYGVQSFDVKAYDLESISALATDATNTEAVLNSMRAAASEMGAAKMRIDSQTDFTGKLMDAIDRGIGVLVDADMNAESARLSALQTQQQLGIQALSIANQNSQNILSLFR